MSNENKFTRYIFAIAIGFGIGMEVSIVTAIGCSTVLLLATIFFSLIESSYSVMHYGSNKGSAIGSNNNASSQYNQVNHWEARRIKMNNYRYDHIIKTHNMKGSKINSVDEGVEKFSHLFNVGDKAARPFFENSYVKSILNISSQEVVKSSVKKDNQVSKNFWADISKEVSKNDSQSKDTCSGPSCSKGVTAFDFRCFNCRMRFCESCKGNSITCPSCS